MNIYDISKETGVSIATVSRVINNSANVSDKTREKVLAAIRESGYTPNVFARGLGLNTMKTIGIMCADSSDQYLARAVYYIEQDLRRYNYDSFLSCTGYDIEVKQKCLNMLLSKRVDAVILVGSNYVESQDELNAYIKNAAATVPVMLVNGVMNAPNIYSTVCDDRAAIRDMTEKYISCGRKNLLYLYNSLSYSGLKKLDGFKDAMKAAGLSAGKSNMKLIKPHIKSIHEIESEVAEIFSSGIVCDGVICSDDIIAAAVLKYAKHKGISVPDDMFIAGFNNFDIAECCEPELTSVDNKLETICHQCVDTLMNVFSGEKAALQKAVFSAEIIERESTGFARS